METKKCPLSMESCPECGGNVEVFIPTDERYFVGCEKCRIRGSTQHKIIKAIEEWNEIIAS